MSAIEQANRYRLLSQHFQVCSELSTEERQKYISGPAVSDPSLREELRSLFEYHGADPSGLEAPTPPPMLPVARLQDTRIRKRRRASTVLLIVGGGLAAAAMVLASRVWVLGSLESDLRSETLVGLSRGVGQRVTSLRSWAERQKLHARAVLSDPELLRHIAILAETAEQGKGDRDQLLASPSYRPVFDQLSNAPPEISDLGFVVISSSGIDVCAESDIIVGRRVTAGGAAYLRRAVLGEWLVSRPYPDRQFALGLTPDYTRPVMFVAGPAYDPAGKLLAMIVFRFNPRREFYGMLAHEGGKVLAFDEKGLLLNDYGETAELRKAGLLAEVPEDQGSLLRLRLRDPGVDLSAGRQPEPDPGTWPPTLMSRRATEDGHGTGAAEYRNVLGRAVLGAWSWLPEWEMGVGVERDVDHVLAPLKRTRTIFNLAFLLPLAFTAALLGMSRSVRNLFAKAGDSTFGSYVLERPIGQGGNAEVHLARHAILKRPTAVKILSTLNPSAATVERFEREARLACRLGHPNTIQVFDYGETPEGKLYIAMEYVKGVTLAQFLATEGPLPVARALYLLRQIAGALEEAHTLGLVHRDLKPSNIMICSRGGLGDVVKVLDFGIACSSSPSGEDFTRNLDIVGTPAYMAPERIRVPQGLDPRSDIYSFGAVAFHLLTGRNVFEGPGPAELIYQVMTAPRPSPSQLRGKALPAMLERLVLDCLAVEPANRPVDFQKVLDVLEAIVTEDRWDQRDARNWWTANRERIAAFAKLVS